VKGVKAIKVCALDDHMKKLVMLLVFLAACTVPQQTQEMPVQEIQRPQEMPTPVLQLPEKFCTDSDEGKNIFVRGTTQNNDDHVEDSCLSLRIEGKVIQLPKVVEYYCDETNIIAEIIDCEHGCEKGVCLSQPRPEPIRYSLIENGECYEGKNIDNKIVVTKCYNNCLVNTQCSKKGYKSKSATLPFQLSCLAPTDKLILERWMEFDVLQPIDVEFETEVFGSENILVGVVDKSENVYATLIERLVSKNLCFGHGTGRTTAHLEPGQYEVRIGAQAVQPHLLRSFRGEDFSVAFI